MNPFPRTWIDIDLHAFSANLRWLRNRIPAQTKLGLVCKADGYGHGIVPIARAAVQHGVDWLCTATVQEGITLRYAGISQPIMVLSPMLPIEAEQAVFYNLRIAVENFETAVALSEAAQAQNGTAMVHLEVDTGLARFGCMPEEALDLAQRIRMLPGIECEGLCHHYIDSGMNKPRTDCQQKIFASVVQEFETAGIRPKMIHAANSAGTALRGDSFYDLVRVGILAYGIDPWKQFPDDLKPIMTWQVRVTAIRRVRAGTTIGYSETFTTDHDAVIATLGAGYGDGYPRSLSSLGFVSIHGKEAPITGLVCMDQLMIDVTDIPETKIGDEAWLIGNEVTVERLSTLAKTNCHEITTRIMSRVPRRFVGS